MKYRNLAGRRVSQLGFGAMRLPTKEGTLDEAGATKMIHFALDNGINYIDTAWPYHDGESEPVIGRALQGGYRKATYIATKSPTWLITDESDFEDILDKQLQRLQTDHIDFYLLHALNQKHWEICRRFDGLGFLTRMKEKGKILHAGFSFHDEFPLFREIVDTYDWEFAQIQYNYLDRTYQAGEAGLDYARSRGLDVIVMEPLRGGNLAGPLPSQVAELWKRGTNGWTPVEWALRWVWNDPLVSLLLSGMSNMEQLKENLRVASEASADSLSGEQLALVDSVEAAYRGLIPVDCTGCGYCMPCPSGVDIPGNFSVWNEYHMFGRNEKANRYSTLDEGVRADRCIECGACLDHCPQQIAIPTELKRLASALSV